MKLAGKNRVEIPVPSSEQNGNGKPTTRTIQFNNPTLENRGILRVKLESTAPMIMHSFSAEAQKQIEDKQTGAPKAKKMPKIPEQLCLQGLHVIGKKPATLEEAQTCALGFPATAFKQGIVRAAKMCDMAMTDAKASIFVKGTDGDLVRIAFEGIVNRQDWVRNENGVCDLRWRAEIQKWSAELTIVYMMTMVNAPNIVNMLAIAGETVGIGAWRPQNLGTHGTFKIVHAVAEEPNFNTKA